jgi:hypothetical protein
MIRRPVGLVLVFLVILGSVTPARAQQGTIVAKPDRTWLWTILGAAAGAGMGFLVGYDVDDAGTPTQTERYSVTATLVGGAIGAGIGFAFGRYRARHLPEYYVQVGEATTAATLTEGIRVSPRMFTANDLVDACRETRPVARLEIVPAALELPVDGRYPLNRISIVAVNTQGVAIVPGVPIVLETEDTTPPVVQLRSDDPDFNAGVLHVVRPGNFRVRARTICGAPFAEVTVYGTVR